MGVSDQRRPVVLCDASPLIFLAKMDRLALIARVTGRQLVALDCVVREILSDEAPPVERQRLHTWLANVQTITYEGSLFASDALSRSDHSSLAWAVTHGAEWLLADERLLRRFAQAHGIKVIGCCGVLLQAVQEGLLSAPDARACINTAVREHGLRISVELYQRLMTQMDRAATTSGLS